MATLAEIRAAALAVLGPCGALDGGWRLDSVTRLGARGAALVLRLGEQDGLGLEWVEPAEGDPAPAFRRGPRYTASYRRGPGLVDVDDAGTDEALRARAHRACEALAAVAEGPSLAAPAPEAAGEDAWADVDGLAEVLGQAFRRDLGTEALTNPEGWQVDEVRVFQRWERVAEVLLSAPEPARTLAFIVTPRDDERPAYARSRRLDLVYYSDDLPPSEHHALYLRDRPTIERVAAWLRAWDGDAK